jgi:hypothetical protein
MLKDVQTSTQIRDHSRDSRPDVFDLPACRSCQKAKGDRFSVIAMFKR